MIEFLLIYFVISLIVFGVFHWRLSDEFLYEPVKGLVAAIFWPYSLIGIVLDWIKE